MRELSHGNSDQIDLDEALAVAAAAARKAGEIARRSGGRQESSTQRKQGLDIVTEADFEAQAAIVGELRRRFGGHNFIAEEAPVGNSAPSRFRWIIDPIDGTINFASGLPLFSTSIALQDGGETVLGLVYQPLTNELYTALVGRGAFLNGKGLHVSDTRLLDNSVLAFMLTSHYEPAEVDSVLRVVRNFSPHVRGLRLLVSQSLELAFVARGSLDVTLSLKSSGFSSAAGALLVREAGGNVTDTGGQPFVPRVSRSLVASNRWVHDAVLRLVSTAGVG